jgi:hypothetical protein
VPDTDELATPPESPRSGAGSALRLGGRLFAGLVVGVGAVAVVVASAALPVPTTRLEPQAVTVTPVPTSQQLACAGSVLRLGSATGENATSTSPLGTPATTKAATEGDADVTVLETPDGGESGSGAPIIVSGAAGASARLAGAQSQYVNVGDFRGFAASVCSRPSSDSWLVGGSTSTGRTTLLTLSNPGTLASTVTIELWGEQGAIEAPGTSGIVVPAGSQRVLSLAGFAPDRSALAVHVTSRGGPVGANLQQSIVRGIDPGGVDVVGTVAAPAPTTVIPGVVVSGSAAAAQSLGRSGYSDLSTVVRAFAPGGEATTATVSIVPESDGLAGASFEMDLPANTVVDVPVELDDGSYSITITSEVPVVAAARASAVTEEALGGASDLAWFSAAPALVGTAFVAVAAGPSPTLHVANEGSSAATVSVKLRGGGTVSLAVAAGGAASIAVAAGSTYTVSDADGMFASVGYATPGQIAGYVIDNSTTAESPVVVYP